jgi:F-type H+-transporting ATPase subunit b
MKNLARYSFIFIALTIALIDAAMAAGKGANHVPSIKDLMYPAINFTVLVAFLIFKLKKPIKEGFDKKAVEVESLMNSAAKKNKDAEEKLKTLKTKMDTLPTEVAKIQKDYEQDVTVFMQSQANETQTVIARTKRDLENKLEGEKNELVLNLNEELLSSVIAKAQQAIGSNNDYKSKATQKIVSELR